MTAQMIEARSEVQRPEPAPLTSSVLDHARDAGNVYALAGGFGYRNNDGLWPSYNCLDLWTPTPMCPDPLMSVAGTYKEWDTATWQPGFTFSVYGGVQCRAVGLDIADQNAEVKRVFDRAQGKGVERALKANRFVASAKAPDGPYYGQWTAPNDLTPGAAIPLTVALALLEGDAADKYAGIPTIHMPRAAATILEVSGLIVWIGDLAFTRNGSRVAIGGGYDDPVMLATGLWTMYATGDIYVEHADVLDVKDYPVMPQMAKTGPSNNLIENGVVSMAERMFRVAVDCYVAKVTGKAF